MSYEEGAALAQKWQTLFIECSAKTKVGVKEAFEELVTKVHTKISIYPNYYNLIVDTFFFFVSLVLQDR